MGRACVVGAGAEAGGVGVSSFGPDLPNSGKGAIVEWYTPAWVFESLGLRFDLDPCSPVDRVLSWVPAETRYTSKDDGLSKPWVGRVWMNPPYGTQTQVWMRRLAEHGNGIALVFSRTDCGWFHDACATADAVLFMRGRVKFVDGDGKAGGTPACGSIMVAWGAENARALEKMALAGQGTLARLRP